MRSHDVNAGESQAAKCKEGDIREQQANRMDLDHEGAKVIADRQAMQELDQNIIISQRDRPINGSLVKGVDGGDMRDQKCRRRNLTKTSRKGLVKEVGIKEPGRKEMGRMVR